MTKQKATTKAVPTKVVRTEAALSPLKIALEAVYKELWATGKVESQKEFADRIGFKPASLSGYMSSRGVEPSKPLINAIKKEFGIDIRDYNPDAALKAEEPSGYASQTDAELLALKANVYIIKLKLVDVLCEVTKRPSSEVTRQIEKEITEQLDIYIGQFGKQK